MCEEKEPIITKPDLPLHKYLWSIVKNSSKVERLFCIAGIITIIVCATLIAYFTMMMANTIASIKDEAPHEWYITREMWLAKVTLKLTTIPAEFTPIMLVVVQNTVGPECNRFITCATEIQNLQLWYMNDKHYDDIGYNFLVGNDGRVYEGRGWNVQGAHTLGYNQCSVGIGFTGDYREEISIHAEVTKDQLNRTQMLLTEGVKLGFLRPDYLIVGARDIRDTDSPGSNLYNAIQKWPNYDHQNRFKDLSCEQMKLKYGNQILWERSNEALQSDT